MSLGGRFFKKGKTQMNKVLVFVLALCFCLASTAAFGQERYGSIEGTVKDQQGALVPGITVTITGPGAFNRTVTTDNQGFFRMIDVPPGSYSVTTSGGNFQSANKKDVQVVLGQATPVEFSVQPAQIGATVNVTGADVAPIDSSTSKIQTNITARDIELIPKGTNFASALKAAAPVRAEAKAASVPA